eukprot:gene795-746_t
MAANVAQVFERNQDATCYVGNLDPKVDDELLWELMVQAGPVQSLSLPRDKITGTHQGYGFVEFKHEEDADYCVRIMNMVKLFQKPIRVNKSAQDKKNQEVGANLFIGNLDEMVDEKLLYDTFSSFGVILFAKVMRDPDSAESRGFGFISFDNFDASDAALSAMNGQFLANRPINISYAYKKETRGERHGSAAERLLAANRPDPNKDTSSTAPPPKFRDEPKGLAQSRPPAAKSGGPKAGPPTNLPGMPPGMKAPGMPSMPGLPPGMPMPYVFILKKTSFHTNFDRRLYHQTARSASMGANTHQPPGPDRAMKPLAKHARRGGSWKIVSSKFARMLSSENRYRQTIFFRHSYLRPGMPKFPGMPGMPPGMPTMPGLGKVPPGMPPGMPPMMPPGMPFPPGMPPGMPKPPGMRLDSAVSVSAVSLSNVNIRVLNDFLTVGVTAPYGRGLYGNQYFTDGDDFEEHVISANTRGHGSGPRDDTAIITFTRIPSTHLARQGIADSGGSMVSQCRCRAIMGETRLPALSSLSKEQGSE